MNMSDNPGAGARWDECRLKRHFSLYLPCRKLGFSEPAPSAAPERPYGGLFLIGLTIA